VSILDKAGKTNVDGHLEERVAAHHYNWLLCSVQELFCWIHWVWERGPENLGKNPTLAQQGGGRIKPWYEIKLFHPFREPHKSVDYSTFHLAEIDKLYDEVGIVA
jgi:hypothetical protein